MLPHNRVKCVNNPMDVEMMPPRDCGAFGPMSMTETSCKLVVEFNLHAIVKSVILTVHTLSLAT
jgi:hypothetical protein